MYEANIDFKNINTMEELLNLKKDIEEMKKNPISMRKIVTLSDVEYLINLFIKLCEDKGSEIIFKKWLYSKLDGKKEQKRGKDSPDYIIKSYKENGKKDNTMGAFNCFVEWQTPYTLNRLQIKPNKLKDIIVEDLKDLTKDPGLKLMTLKLVNNIFYVVTATNKNYLEDESLLKYFQSF